ncbi:hypothetical protein MFFC18_43420 [Mariniblastus fucicola]|uniref:Uncharacterized protein n=1 Tax=Mariniblastus fucicola TaxID=980251 RepID=A0A5B9PQ48_9BACT|nr:hypothetical protein MFFC18_43420 [Mariniblastus fucicola]
MGSIDGVYATAAAWRDGVEVVSLLFDPDEVAYRTLVEKAKQFKCTSKVFAHSKSQLEVANELVGDKAVMANESQKPRFAKASDQKYYLANSPLKSLPMCGCQMTKLNAAMGLGQPVDALLSPRQKVLAKRILRRLESDPDSLDGFISPSDDNELGDYSTKLEAALSK